MRDTIDMAREAGWPDSLVAPVIMAKLAEFAALVRADAIADEREACAELIEALPCDCCWPEDSRSIAEDFADVIRDRGNT